MKALLIASALGIISCLCRTARCAEFPESPLDPESYPVTVSFKGATILRIQEELNAKVPGVIFSLECDQRDSAQVTLEANNIPLAHVLDDITRSVHYEWKYDRANHTINLFPKNTKRYEYYPFTETILPVDIKGRDKAQVLGDLLSFTKDRPFQIIFMANYNAFQGDRPLKGVLENITLREALNWLCWNSGGLHYWRCSRNNAGYAILGYGNRQASTQDAARN